MNNNRISPFAKPFIPKTIKTNVIQLKYNNIKQTKNIEPIKVKSNNLNKDKYLYNGLYSTTDNNYNYILNVFRPIY